MNEAHTQTGSKIRATAVRTLMAVTLKSRPLEAALDDMATEAKLEARDRAFVLNLVMLCLRRYGSLKRLLADMLDSGLPKNATWTEAALITGLAQILLMRTADHAAVNETVSLIKNLSGKEAGFAGLVNAVLRKATREHDALLTKLNRTPKNDVPSWIYDSWAKSYGPANATAIAATLQTTPQLDITVKDKTTLADWAGQLGATTTPTGSLRLPLCDVTALPGYDTGDWWVQDMSAAIPATLLGNITGKHVLDLCAAPGGKTMQLAASGARVTSVDRSENRLKRLHANLARTDLRADVYAKDAARFTPKTPVDHILLDAPCSATGTLRRNPDVIWTKNEGDIKKLASLQERILDHAFSLLPVGGTLLYCVCSLEEIEGKGQIEGFLKAEPKAKRVPITASELGGLTELVTKDGDLLCLPSYLADKGGLDGFYAARITRQKI
ncbi:RsmB/NOP family class I SAM-dependent RNA methyltransferase [Kordiimonas pumila]|uniref:RsmB/NOP family class I SAM-dependent RNA methyltransferase n=1 Tax=Kordiimonas pumila TaxID=2161677 RepID=A0ABV7D4F0_9PROT|nr:transcription antitermination factor NusB [Kordiimonas pumila]